MDPKMATTVVEKLVGRAYQRWVESIMAAPVPRERYRHFPARVGAITEVAESVRRVTLTGLADYELNGPDEYLGLFLPRAGRPLVVPAESTLRVGAMLARMPEEDRPELRWYSVRAQRGDELDLDIVRHGDAGPGTAWAGRVLVGDEVGVRQGSAGYRPPALGEWQLLVADETAMPALAGIIDFAHSQPDLDWSGVRAIVEFPDAEHAPPLPEAPFEVTAVRRPEAPGSGVLPLVEALDQGSVHSAWVCGEAGGVAAVRRHLMREVGVDKRRIFYSGYWKLGQARG
jgi:NADPH-dependent ferric siderophore reductase